MKRRPRRLLLLSYGTFRFRRAVRAEIRAAWRGRRCWAALAFLMLCFLGFAPLEWLEGSGEWYRAFPMLCGLVCWGSAWLGADLLSLRYKENPEPLREWRPVEFAARAAGRLAPFDGVLLAWSGTYMLRSLSSQGEAALPWIWAASAAALISSGLAYFSLAAALSATARRPRRWALAPAAVVVGTIALLTLLWLLDTRLGGSPGSKVPSPDQLPMALLAPNVVVGVESALLYERILPFSAGLRLPGNAEYPFAAAAAFLAYAVPPALVVWAVAARRWQRGGSKPSERRLPRTPEHATP
jgi:hypothetical protein